MIEYKKEVYKFLKIIIKDIQTDKEIGNIKNVSYIVDNDFENSDYYSEWVLPNVNIPKNLINYEDEIINQLDELTDKELVEEQILTISIEYDD